MKNIFSALFFLIFFCVNSYAQDTIITVTNEAIISRITEISSSEVKYKKIGLPDGPVYVEPKSNIRSIRYSNGTIESFPGPEVQQTNAPIVKENAKFIPLTKSSYTYKDKLIKDRQMFKIMLAENDPALKLAVKKAKSAKWKKYFGFGIIPFGASAMVYMAFANIASKSPTYSGMADNYRIESYVDGAIALAFGATGITYNIIYKKKRAAAIDLFNSKR
jgi:hypothetical protein